MPDKRIAVLGAGTMGAGIAQLAAQSGYEVLLYDIQDDFVQRGLGSIESSWGKRVSQRKMTEEEKSAGLSRITTTTNRDDAASCNIVIEAAPEDLNLKREIFTALSERSGPDTILASNTSSLSITSIASAARTGILPSSRARS
jgi:3-hydroxybutyryl-CoA dehydrogenase